MISFLQTKHRAFYFESMFRGKLDPSPAGGHSMTYSARHSFDHRPKYEDAFTSNTVCRRESTVRTGVALCIKPKYGKA